MKGNIAIIAALSGELKPLVTHPTAKNWRRVPSSKGTELWEYRHAEGCWLAVCAGMGAHRAILAFCEAEKRMKLDAVCSIGWAGALGERIGVPSVQPARRGRGGGAAEGSIFAGAVCSVSQIIDAQTGERFRPAHSASEMPILVTTPYVAMGKEKQRLALTYGASLVDMEAAAVARIALSKGMPFYCFKAISDDSKAHLPDINPFIGKNGQLKMVPFLLHVLARPGYWVGLIKLGKHSSEAAANLAEGIYDWLDERGYVRRSMGDYK